MELPKRKSNRLPDFNYSQCGCYFLTLCTEKKRPLLCRIKEGTVFEPPSAVLSQYGRIVQNKIQNIPDYYPDITVENHVIMPNHIHLLLSLHKVDKQKTVPANQRIPALISAFKRFTNQESGISLWQRSYYDHVIRCEDDFLKIWKYIEDNPEKWLEDRFYISEI